MIQSSDQDCSSRSIKFHQQTQFPDSVDLPSSPQCGLSDTQVIGCVDRATGSDSIVYLYQFDHQPVINGSMDQLTDYQLDRPDPVPRLDPDRSIGRIHDDGSIRSGLIGLDWIRWWINRITQFWTDWPRPDVLIRPRPWYPDLTSWPRQLTQITQFQTQIKLPRLRCGYQVHVIRCQIQMSPDRWSLSVVFVVLFVNWMDWITQFPDTIWLDQWIGLDWFYQ